MRLIDGKEIRERNLDYKNLFTLKRYFSYTIHCGPPLVEECVL